MIGLGAPPAHSLEKLNTPTIVIRTATLKEELRIITNTIRQLPFYHKYDYRVALPDDLITGLLSKSIKGAVPNLRHGSTSLPLPLLGKYANNVYFPRYKREDPENAIKKMELSRTTIEKVFPIFIKLSQQWGFKLPNQYEIVLTKWGVGGLFNADNGTVFRGINQILQTKYDPTLGVVHEMVHIGVAKFVTKYKLTHPEKEGLVEGFCQVIFSELFPEQKAVITPKADVNILPFVSTTQALNNLPGALEEYISKFPR